MAGQDERIDTRPRGDQCYAADGSPKRAYNSRAKAERFAHRTNQDHKNDAPVHAYLCPGSAHWHVGHGAARGKR